MSTRPAFGQHIKLPRPTGMALAVGLIVSGQCASAVQPDEILANPALESRARAISAELRCLVCQNQSIDDSDAPLARDLRVLVRERLVAGDSDAETRGYVVKRYGEFVLLRPTLSPHTALLWGGPFAIVAAALAGIVLFSRRAVRSAPPPLTAAEQRSLSELSGRESG